MALFKADYSSALTGLEVITAMTDHAIRVERLLITSWVGLHLQIISDPGGPKESILSAKLRATAGMLGNYDFSDAFVLTAGTGKSLGLTTVYQGAPADYSVMLWYEYVSG